MTSEVPLAVVVRAGRPCSDTNFEAIMTPLYSEIKAGEAPR
jgi:hypothetical protein